MLIITSSVYKFPYSPEEGLMVWNVDSVEELKDRLKIYIEEDYEKRVKDFNDDYLRLSMELYNDNISTYLKLEKKEELYYSVDELVSLHSREINLEYEKGLVASYIS